MDRERLRLAGIVTITILGAVPAVYGAAPVGTAFTYQGQLKLGGAPVNISCDFDVGLWTAEAGGTELGVQVIQTEVKNGLFMLKLNEASQFGANAFNGEARWLEVAVCCPDPAGATCTGSDFATLPRQELTPSPYALFAANGPGGDGGFWTADGEDIYNTNAGNVGIGTPSPVAPLHVDGSAVFRGPGPWADVRAFGAIGNGQSHALSERFATLAEARLTYPHATSLGDEIDRIAIQAAIDSLQGTCIDNTCVGGSQEGDLCDVHVQCPNDPVDVKNVGMCDNLVCVGGINDGKSCIPDWTCRGSGTVFFPVGRYYVTSSMDEPAITVAGRQVVLKGAGFGSSLINHGTGDLLQIGDGINFFSNTVVDSLAFHGTALTGWSINARLAPNTRIVRCNISNSSLDRGGISLVESISSTVSNTLFGIKGTAINVGSASFQVWIAGNRIDGCSDCGGNRGTGIYLGAGSAHMAGNTIESLLVGIDMQGGGRAYVLTGNYFESNATDILSRAAGGALTGLVIEGGFHSDGLNSNHAIELDNAFGVVIQGNFFRGKHPSDENLPPSTPIKLTSVQRYKVGPNFFEDATELQVTSTGEGFVQTTGGRIGIGTPNPTEKLDVVGNVKASGTIQAGSITIDGASEQGTLHIADNVSNGTTVKIRNVNPGPLGNAHARIILERGVPYGASEILFQTAESKEVPQTTDWRLGVLRSGGSTTRHFAISTNFDTSATAPEFSIAAGRVGIGRIPTSHKLEVDGNAGKTVGGNTWEVISDRRVKKNIETIEGALDKLDKVRVTSFEYTDEYRAAHPDAENRRYMNVIAQEFAKVFPDHVSSMRGVLPGRGELLTVDTHPLTIYSVAAIQELHGIVKEKDAEIVALQSRVTALEQSVGKFCLPDRASILGIATPALAALCLFGFLVMGRTRSGEPR